MGCDVSAAEPRVVVETEQKFLVDREAFEQVRGLCKRVDVMQCYVATDQGDGGYEVRFRRSEGDGRTGFKCTLKRRRQASAIARDEIEFGIDHATFSAAWDSTTWRFDKDRYSGGPLGDWTVDVFTSGPLQGVAVAELEYGDGVSDLGGYLRAKHQPTPKWLLRTAEQSDWALYPAVVDLTAERVNLVAAGAVEMSERLRRLLANAAAAEMTALAQATGQYDDNFPKYVKRPAAPRLTRQGVRDLGYSKRGGVL